MKTRIGYIYYTFFPVTGGASVHGYNLAKELHKLGYELWKLNGLPDPWTVKQQQGIRGLWRMLRYCDVIYIRMDAFLNLRNLTAIIALLWGKRVIVELNSPSDELHLFGRGKRYIRMADRLYRLILQRVDAVIVVSPEIDEWCRKELRLTNTHIIENGGERFDGGESAGGESGGERFGDRQHGQMLPGNRFPGPDNSGDGESGVDNSGDDESRSEPAIEQQSSDQSTTEQQIKNQVASIRRRFDTVIVWSGSANAMQDLVWLRQIGDNLQPNQALILALFENPETSTRLPGRENIFQFLNPSRESVKQMIGSADIGLAFYNSSSWSRWGFYNSPLKIHEYLVNGLLAITNIDGSPTLRAHPRFRRAESVEAVFDLIREYHTTPDKSAGKTDFSGQTDTTPPDNEISETGVPESAVSPDRPAQAASGRTWADVAIETDEVIRQVLA